MSRSPLLALGLIVALTGCGGAEHPARTSASVAAEGLHALPYATLQDWVSYGTQVAEVKVTGEREAQIPAESTWDTSPTSSRIVTVSIVRTLWTAPGARAKTASIEFTANGWAYTTTSRKPIVDPDGPRLEVGESYVIPFTQFEGGFAPMATAATMHLTADHRIELAPGQDDGGPRELSGLTPDEARGRLASVKPDPAADSKRSLPPEQRWRAVITERRAGQG